jgi:hypothetical protein
MALFLAGTTFLKKVYLPFAGFLCTRCLCVTNSLTAASTLKSKVQMWEHDSDNLKNTKILYKEKNQILFLNKAIIYVVIDAI